jgi:hypothetical protein
MMTFNSKSAVIALAAAVCLSAAPAFAGIERLDQDDVPESWFINFSAQLGGSGLSSSFDNIKAFTSSATTYTINSQTYSITAPSKFEDISSSGGHKAIEGFSIVNPNTTSTWAQTSINSTPGGTLITASGNSFTGTGTTLNFNLYFEGSQTDGAHFFLEFYKGTTFVTGYEIKDLLVTGSLHPDGFEQTNYSQAPVSAVPLPSSAWMGGLALIGGIGGLMFRRRRSRQLLA